MLHRQSQDPFKLQEQKQPQKSYFLKSFFHASRGNSENVQVDQDRKSVV